MPPSSSKRYSSPLEDEPSAKRRQTILETVANDLDDATHDGLDKAVLEDYGNGPVESIRDFGILLDKIVANSKGKLNKKYRHGPTARALIEDHQLMDKLKKGWVDKSFKEIRNLKILRPSQGSRRALGVPIENKDAAIGAWKQEYHGIAHKVLLQAVDHVHTMPKEKQNAKIIPVTQSSGTGKSKTIDKIATERILIPICLREDLDENYFAYPHSDASVRNHLLKAPTSEELECKNYLRSFLSSLFTQANSFFAENEERVPYTTIAMQFYDFFADISSRDNFYKEVIDKVDLQKNSINHVLESFRMFEASLKACCSEWPNHNICPILISMDEIHVLFSPAVQPGLDYDLYSRLKSVLSEVVSEAICFVFLSTATSVSKIAPSKQVAPSMRERDDEHFLPAPFTELPFDVHLVSDPLVPEKETLSTVGSLEFTAKFGRPLFYATYLSRKAQNEVQDRIVSKMMRIVREKLSGGGWPPESFARLDASSIAVLSARFLLDLSPTASSSKQYEQELVRSHLRMLYSVHQDRQGMVTGSSPEPLIAEASAQIMHSSITVRGEEKAYMDVWDLLRKYVDDGLAPQGTIGELIGRVLSILAMDNAINGLTDLEHRELKYQTPVTVAAYYKALLTDEAWESLRQSIPANHAKLSKASAAMTFELAFSNAYFHFSHYGKANDVTPMQDCSAWALWLRGTAILCQPNQELTDRAIPIYFQNLGAVSPKSVSLALEQDKTGRSADPLTIGIQSVETLGLFSQGKTIPYIAAVHCYALTSDEGICVPTPSPYSLRHPHKDEEAPRYQIDFRGLAAYREVTTSIKVDIQRMIDGSKNALFNHHPRPYGIPSLRQMLPVLTGDLDATRWFGGPGCSPQEVSERNKGKQRAVEQNVSSSPEDAYNVGSTSQVTLRSTVPNKSNCCHV